MECLSGRLSFQWGLFLMPATSPSPKEVSALRKLDSASGGRYVKCDLAAEQKRQLADMAESVSDADVWAYVVGCVERDHSFSLKPQEVGWSANLTGGKSAGGHEGLTLVARASTPYKAVLSLWFRDTYILNGKWEASDRLKDLDL